MCSLCFENNFPTTLVQKTIFDQDFSRENFFLKVFQEMTLKFLLLFIFLKKIFWGNF